MFHVSHWEQDKVASKYSVCLSEICRCRQSLNVGPIAVISVMSGCESILCGPFAKRMDNERVASDARCQSSSSSACEQDKQYISKFGT